MRKLQIIFAVLLTAMCFTSANAVVTITAPNVPEQLEEIVSGQEYYLYNINLERYVALNSSNYLCFGTTGVPFKVEKRDDGNYCFGRHNGTEMRYIEGYNNYIYWNQTSNKDISYAGFNIVNNNGVYKIQNIPENSRYYDANSWWGMRDNNYNNVYYNGTANTAWMFFPNGVDDTEFKRYASKCLLYDAIVSAEANGYHIERYEDIYNDETKTNSQLNAVANELNNGNSLSTTHSYLFPSWSDYPILITSIGSLKRESSSNNYLSNYTYSSSSPNTNKGKTNTLKTSVYVDEPSTLSFIIDCDPRWTNEPTMPLQVFVDGELVYDYKGETYRYYYDSYFGRVLHGTNGNEYRPYGSSYSYNYSYHSYNRHFINLSPGHHLVDIVTTQNYDGTGYFYTYFREIGVEKVPTIEVNLAKAGSLGDEVLRAMDNNPLIEESNIRNVRRLKISGKMGDADFTELYNMTQLYALDLTDADVTEIKTGQLSQYYHNSLSNLHELKLPKKLVTIGQEAFYATYIDDVDIPETVTSIGDFAFSNTRLREANIPNVTSIGHNAFRGCTMLNKVVMKNVASMGINAFAECYNIKDVEFDGTLTAIPQRSFYYCDEIENICLPESVETIESYAFYRNSKSKLAKLPENLKYIQDNAFYQNYQATFCLPNGLKTIGASALWSADHMTEGVPSSVTSIGTDSFHYTWWHSILDTLMLPPNSSFGSNAFAGSHVKNIVIPENINNLSTASIFANCDSLKSIKFLSSTLVKVASSFVDGLNKKSIKVLVPDYLKYTYMRDSYWMDFTIETFPTTELDSIVVRQNLTLSQHDRFEGTPSLSVVGGIVFELEGAAGMELKNVVLNNNLNADLYAQIVSGTDNVNVNGSMSQSIHTLANKWYFMSLPFDCDLSKTKNNDAKYAIRYYDGAGRANVASSRTPLVDDGNTEFYLYNVEAGAYLVGANEWSTRASISTTNKYAFKITNNGNGTWTLKDYVQTQNAWKSMFVDDAEGIWVDNNTGANANNWVITHVGDNKYEITNKGIADGKLGAVLGSDDTRLYMNDKANATTWVFVPVNGTKVNWKNYDCSKDIIPTGTGFIFMTSKDSWTRFYSVDNGTKNRVFEGSENENNEFHYELQKHPSENAADRGWNLVGNPYPNYYNNHKISFAAPITLWDGTTYKAYSLRDDDIAIKPCQAIFVQCPEDVAEISFPAAGRQTSSVITDQANAPARGEMNNVRQIIDLSLTNDTYTDDTRVVINPEASLSYEVGSDASKFMSMDAAVQQIYSLDAVNNRYAINERPIAEGTVALGISIPAEGTYTLSLKRNQAETVLLTDNETGFTHDLTADDYIFTAKAGANDGRFVLSIVAAEVTSVENVENNAASHYDMYTVDGIRVNNAAKSGVYIKRSGNKVTKVVVK